MERVLQRRCVRTDNRGEVQDFAKGDEPGRSRRRLRGVRLDQWGHRQDGDMDHRSADQLRTHQQRIGPPLHSIINTKAQAFDCFFLASLRRVFPYLCQFVAQ